MGLPQKLEQDQYSLSVSLISHVHLQIKLDSMRLQEPLPSRRGGTTQVVGEGFGQMRKISDLQEFSHPAFSHLLPHGEGKEAKDCFTLKR